MAYRVKRGDTLFLIATRFGITVWQLMKLNPQIRNPNKIYVGEIITVPSRKWEKPQQHRAQRHREQHRN